MDPKDRENVKNALARIVESFTDGRVEYVRYRQQELFNLHHSLVDNASTICESLVWDSRKGEQAKQEAETEYYLTLGAVRHFYDSLDFDRELEKEYRVANGKNNEERRVGFGMVVIRPTSHTRFYSTVVPLAAALSAGNCVVVELPLSQPEDGASQQIDTVLHSILTEALDYNVFCTINSIEDDLSKADLDTPWVLVVDQNQQPTDLPERHLISSANARSLAVVDRTADVEEAARLITRARFSFGGSSPYAPELVLVNEFVKAKFIKACSRFSDGEGVCEEIEVQRRKSYLSGPRIGGKTLAVSTFSSLVDATFAYAGSTPLLVGYFFAHPTAAKYLSQYLPCQISCTNQIPAHLLVGPAAPCTLTRPDFLYRYSREMFSRPMPQFIEPVPAAFKVVDEYLGSLRGRKPNAQTSNTKGKKLRALATKPLKPIIQPDNADLGFFETGFLLAAGLAVLPWVGWASYVLGRRLMNKFQ